MRPLPVRAPPGVGERVSLRLSLGEVVVVYLSLPATSVGTGVPLGGLHQGQSGPQGAVIPGTRASRAQRSPQTLGHQPRWGQLKRLPKYIHQSNGSYTFLKGERMF